MSSVSLRFAGSAPPLPRTHNTYLLTIHLPHRANSSAILPAHAPATPGVPCAPDITDKYISVFPTILPG